MTFIFVKSSRGYVCFLFHSLSMFLEFPSGPWDPLTTLRPVPVNWDVILVEQEAKATERSAVEEVLAADLRQSDDITLMLNRPSRLHTRENIAKIWKSICFICFICLHRNVWPFFSEGLRSWSKEKQSFYKSWRTCPIAKFHCAQMLPYLVIGMGHYLYGCVLCVGVCLYENYIYIYILEYNVVYCRVVSCNVMQCKVAWCCVT